MKYKSNKACSNCALTSADITGRTGTRTTFSAKALRKSTASTTALGPVGLKTQFDVTSRRRLIRRTFEKQAKQIE
jgi:hypothetical protein